MKIIYEKMNHCIICIEDDPTNVFVMKHKAHCDCEYTVHHKCLKLWIDQQNKCVICRESYLVEDGLIFLRFGCLVIGTMFAMTLLWIFILKLLIH